MNTRSLHTVLSAQEKARLADMLGRQDAVLSAYLFGSMSLGLAREGSDVDVAVRFRRGIPEDRRFEVRGELQSLLETYFNRTVDLVVMNESSLVLLYQVFSTGILLFARDPEEEEAFRWQKLKEFFDFRFYLSKDYAETERFFGVDRD